MGKQMTEMLKGTLEGIGAALSKAGAQGKVIEQVADLTGEVRAQTGGGGLSFARLNGPLNGDTGGGGIKAGACEGKLAFRTGGGGMEVTGGSGSLDGRNGGGSVTVKEFQGPVHVSTGGGGVTVEKVQGAVEAATGGGSISAVLTSELSDTVKLSTGGGGINVSVPATAAGPKRSCRTTRMRCGQRAPCCRSALLLGELPGRFGNRRYIGLGGSGFTNENRKSVRNPGLACRRPSAVSAARSCRRKGRRRSAARSHI